MILLLDCDDCRLSMQLECEPSAIEGRNLLCPACLHPFTRIIKSPAELHAANVAKALGKERAEQGSGGAGAGGGEPPAFLPPCTCPPDGVAILCRQHGKAAQRRAEALLGGPPACVCDAPELSSGVDYQVGEGRWCLRCGRHVGALGSRPSVITAANTQAPKRPK